MCFHPPVHYFGDTPAEKVNLSLHDPFRHPESVPYDWHRSILLEPAANQVGESLECIISIRTYSREPKARALFCR